MGNTDNTKEALLIEAEELRKELDALKNAYHHDISEYKQSEILHLDSGQNFRTLVENSRDGILIAYQSGYHCYANKRASEITGYSIDELLTMTRFDLVHPDEAERIKERMRQTNAGIKIQNPFRIKIISKSGITIPIEVTSAQTIWLGKIATFTSMRDIAERVHLEKQLRESESHYRLLTEGVADVVWRQDSNNVITYVSPADERMRGYKAEEMIGRHIFEIFTDEGIAHVKEKMKQRVNRVPKGIDQDTLIFEVQQRCKDGSLIWTEILSTAEFDSNKKISGYYGISRDISKRKLAEFEIIKKNDELQKLNATKDKFFSIIAHDLKGPLGSFKQMTEMLHDSYKDFNEIELVRFLDLMKKSSKNIYELLENLLEWSRSQRGTITLKMVEFNLFSITDNIINLLKPVSDIKNIVLSNRINRSYFINADINLLTTILRNLLSNAIKFTFPGGGIFINAEQGYDNIIISVTDSGIGMSKNQIENLFRIDSSISTLGTNKEKGTGLGLILCKEFVEKHGGKIWVESEEGMGSTFYFTLPGKMF